MLLKIFNWPQVSCTTRCPVLASHQLSLPQGKLRKITFTATLPYEQQINKGHVTYTYYINTILIITVASKANECASGSKGA